METWKPINQLEIDFTGIYEVSNLGRIKSLERVWFVGEKKRAKRETILKAGSDPDGYLGVVLCKNKIRKTCKVHLLIWDHFGNRNRKEGDLRVDHIDANKKNCSISNLQLLSHSKNCLKQYQQNGKQLPPGVSLSSNRKSFKARIIIDGKEKHLGTYATAVLAAQAYSDAQNNFTKSI